MRLLLSIAAMVLAATPAFAQAERETLVQAIDSAISRNPTLMAQRQQRGIADETLEQAKSGLRPSVGFTSSVGANGVEYDRSPRSPSAGYPPGGWNERASVGLEARQTLYAGGGLAAEREQARAGVTAAEAELRGAEQELVLNVVSAFVDVRRAERVVAIRETGLASLQQQVRGAGERFTVGEVSRTDVAQAEARAAGAQADLADARAQLSAVRATYEQYVGHPAVQLADAPAAPVLPGTLAEALTIAQGANLRLVSARAQEDAAEQGINIAKAGLRPRVGLVGSAGVREDYYDKTFRDTNMDLILELSIPLYQGGLLSSRTRASRLEADKARYLRMAVEREVSARVTTLWHSVLSSREAIAASLSRVTAAEVALEGAKRELTVGTRITLDVLDQERELLEAQLRVVDAERSNYMAVHGLLVEMGRLRADVVGR